jgi:hypothetical protein
MRLRVDPWEPEFGASIELDDELAPAVGLDLTVEQAGPWQPLPAPSRGRAARCAFVDGVRRIDARLFAEHDDLQAPALAGSWAVGCAWAGERPRITEIRVGRELVVGGGLSPSALCVPLGSTELRFHPSAVAGTAPLDPLRGLQNAMREAEAELARWLLSHGEAELVVADGPLAYVHEGPLLGMAKRQTRAYLDGERARVLAQLKIGERTPIFKLGEQRLERYSWYLRLAEGRPIDGTATGLVRLEVAASGGLENAQALAALASVVLPRFATVFGRDPRAPQNLYPVAALELWLRHRLGDANLIRRAIEARLDEEAAHARTST